MQLTISKSLEKVGERYGFSVRCGALTLTPNESNHFTDFGAPRLDALFRADGGVAQLRGGQSVTRMFGTVHDALMFVQQVHGACKDTETDWELAYQYQGDASYSNHPSA
jgi:hypothetical protein